jgi:chromosome segregation ATPase
VDIWLVKTAMTGGHGVEQLVNGRLASLRHELEKGQLELQRLDDQRARVRETMFRISGAIQVLEELLEELRTETSQAQLAAEPGEQSRSVKFSAQFGRELSSA